VADDLRAGLGWAAGQPEHRADAHDLAVCLARLTDARGSLSAINAGDRDKLLATAATLDAAGCRYQLARTLVFAGGDARSEGEAILIAIGATPMII
jgi:hypothetical protein